ncbi:MAG: hypothetical protein QGG53_42635 [Planctomycetota bacterium]|nr:hypothetical protein [Planctomycetota bacterium]
MKKSDEQIDQEDLHEYRDWTFNVAMIFSSTLHWAVLVQASYLLRRPVPHVLEDGVELSSLDRRISDVIINVRFFIL